MNDKEIDSQLKIAEREVSEMCEKLIAQLEELEDLLLWLMR